MGVLDKILGGAVTFTQNAYIKAMFLVNFTLKYMKFSAVLTITISIDATGRIHSSNFQLSSGPLLNIQQY